MSDFRQDFLRFALEQDVLRFGEFVTKAGRLSPYFFNAGLFNDAMMLAEAGRNVPFAYNRKEAKDHGEGGTLVGAPLAGRVLIIDDVISAGTSVRESVRLIEQAGATPAGVAIALDRMEKGTGNQSAVQEVRQQFGLPVVPIASLADLLALLQDDAQFRQHLEPVQAYRDRYGVAA